jgi:hypothetical protein
VIKKSLRGFLRWNVVDPLADLGNEIVFQRIFDRQCANAGIRNDFYPVGAAACHSLMYLLFRVLSEEPVDSIVEFGSGQSTLLIDRIKPAAARHVCYEEDPAWHEHLGARLTGCDYRRADLVAKAAGSVRYEGYGGLDAPEFDILLVDGPRGVDRFSRYDCVPVALGNARRQYLIIVDDADRRGEKDTIGHLVDGLRGRGDDVKLSYGRGRTAQALITAGRFKRCAYYF